jgi:hypothetical protein
MLVRSADAGSQTEAKVLMNRDVDAKEKKTNSHSSFLRLVLSYMRLV